MTENLKCEQLLQLANLLKEREPKYRYRRGPHGFGRLFGVPNGWNKILVATGEIVATRCSRCDSDCRDYFPIPEGLAE